VTVEPRVEDLLSTIRKAIDDDLGEIGSTTSANSQGTLMRGALREMRVNYDASKSAREDTDTEISKLRERIGRSRIQSTFKTPIMPRLEMESPQPAQLHSGVSRILAGDMGQPAPVLRQSLNDDEPYEQTWAEPAPEPYYQEEAYAHPPALVSPQTAYAAQNSFEHLAETIMARATHDRSLEDMTQELLRGMVKTWLDNNLPDMVERLVREEIERVARRGR
jgi:uncharacterized protein